MSVVSEHKDFLLPVAGIVVVMLIIGFGLSGGNVASLLFPDGSWGENGTGAATAQRSYNKPKYESSPMMSLNSDEDYRAEIDTSKGTIIIDLLEDETPITVNNFVFLARHGFYNSLPFHRINKTLMTIQTGAPNTDGTGDAGYEFEDEITSRMFSDGVVAMANSGPDTNGSQFFIVATGGGQRCQSLNGKHTIFAIVSSGMDVVDAIVAEAVDSNSKPVNNIVVKDIRIVSSIK